MKVIMDIVPRLTSDITIHHMLCSHGDTLIILNELLEQERHEKEALKSELDSEKKLGETAENYAQFAQQE